MIPVLDQSSPVRRTILPVMSPLNRVLIVAIGTGSGQWADAYVKAKAIVSKMTLLEKVGKFLFLANRRLI